MTVEVTFADQRAHEHVLGRDVHLVRLEDGDYAWSAKVPDPAGEDMLVGFSVR